MIDLGGTTRRSSGYGGSREPQACCGRQGEDPSPSSMACLTFRHSRRSLRAPRTNQSEMFRPLVEKALDHAGFGIEHDLEILVFQGGTVVRNADAGLRLNLGIRGPVHPIAHRRQFVGDKDGSALRWVDHLNRRRFAAAAKAAALAFSGRTNSTTVSRSRPSGLNTSRPSSGRFTWVARKSTAAWPI